MTSPSDSGGEVGTASCGYAVGVQITKSCVSVGECQFKRTEMRDTNHMK